MTLDQILDFIEQGVVVGGIDVSPYNEDGSQVIVDLPDGSAFLIGTYETLEAQS